MHFHVFQVASWEKPDSQNCGIPGFRTKESLRPRFIATTSSELLDRIRGAVANAGTWEAQAVEAWGWLSAPLWPTPVMPWAQKQLG